MIFAIRKFKLAILTVIIIALAPLIVATQLGFIPNVRYYWENFYSMDYFEVYSSSGQVNIGKEWSSVGTLDSEESSSVTLSAGFWPYYDFLRVKEVTSSYVRLNVQRPFSRFLEFEESNATWKDDDFTTGWTTYTFSSQGRAVNSSDGVLDISASFVSGERNYYLLKKDLPNLNSTENPYIFVKWKSTDHITRLEIYDSDGNEYKIIVESADEIIHPGTYGGGYSPDWVKTVYKLPLNKTITWIVLGVDSGGGASGSFPVLGDQHAYFDYVRFANSNVISSNIKIVLNDNILFTENLTYPIGADVYSWDLSRFKYEYIEIPFDSNIVQEENFLTISVDKETNFNISSPTIRMMTKLEGIKPVWTEIPYLAPFLYGFSAVEIAVGFLMLRKMHIWVNKQEQE